MRIKRVKKQIPFVVKLFRNSLILALFYFISTYATCDYSSFKDWKALIIFTGFYLVGELMHHYHVSQVNATPKRRVTYVHTLLF